MAEFTMPSLGADMDEGTLLEWLVRTGDKVRRGDVVAVVETAKSTIEVECFATGTVARLLVEPGTTVPVGTPLAEIQTAAEEPSEIPAASLAEARAPAGPAASAERARAHAEAGPLVRHLAERRGVDLERLRGSGPGGRVVRADIERPAAAGGERRRARVTPYARRLAAEMGVELTGVRGTGGDGAIRAADVRGAAEATTAGAGTEKARAPRAAPEEDRAAGMRRAIAGLMSRANREIPHYYLSTPVDMAAAMDWLHDHNRRHPVGERLLPASLLLKAAARAAREVPQLNGFWVDDRFTPGDGVHLGVAVSLRGGGLIVPTVRDADALALPELMARLKDLVTRARGGRLRGSEVAAATITVTNLGDQGVETVLGVIYPPQVALVGFGKVVERPCAVSGLIGVRPQVTATLSADHRATDGAVGARYLTAVDRLLQHPEEL